MRRHGPSELALFTLSALSIAVAVVGAASGCGNPAVDARIEALGEENPSVPESEFHRPGQPCVLCHSVYEGADPEITVGGTIFASPSKIAGELPVAVEGAEVTLIDAEGVVKTATTNCAGNFFLTKEQWNPSFPLQVEVRYPAPGAQEQQKPAPSMASRISRDGSCAGCHYGPPNQGSPGFVFCEEAPQVEFPVPKCVGVTP
ncbi:MAG TPA: hypothetical protein VK459_28770 [Polyangiaceae bacterium]|jgi:hypothetical protein|nr:hypothetical protein [Polyangiaceae bacterium]